MNKQSIMELNNDFAKEIKSSNTTERYYRNR